MEYIGSQCLCQLEVAKNGCFVYNNGKMLIANVNLGGMVWTGRIDCFGQFRVRMFV